MSYANIVEKRATSTIIKMILESTNSTGRPLFYRGQQGWFDALVPNLYRNEQLTKKGSEYYYRKLIAELGRDDYTRGSSLVRLLSELQHYGAKTRMLDVTSNPLVALYFAVEDISGNDDKDGYVFIYSPKKEQVKFDTGHTITIKAAMNLIDQDYINAFFSACETLDTYGRDFTTEGLATTLRDGRGVAISRFMELINQRARVSERLCFPLRIYDDIRIAHLVVPSKCTDRIRQQQGYFIFPAFVNATGKTYDLIKQEVSKSIEEMSFSLQYTESKTKSIVTDFSVFKIPKTYKKQIREELMFLGITGAVVYPDIEHNSDALLEK